MCNEEVTNAIRLEIKRAGILFPDGIDIQPVFIDTGIVRGCVFLDEKHGDPGGVIHSTLFFAAADTLGRGAVYTCGLPAMLVSGHFSFLESVNGDTRSIQVCAEVVSSNASMAVVEVFFYGNKDTLLAVGRLEYGTESEYS